MKKLLAIILAAIMVFAVVACGKTNDNGNDTDTNVDTSVDTSVDTNNDTEADTSVDTEETADEATLESVSKAIMDKYAEFIGLRASYDEYMAELDEADRITYEEFVAGQMMVMPVEDGAEWLQGFDAVPTGYAEAYTFAPGMMGQAFIGYIFRLEDGADVEAFKTQLKENCNPRWNICAAANTTVCENVGNYVYFNMLVVKDETVLDGFTEEQKDAFLSIFTTAFAE